MNGINEGKPHFVALFFLSCKLKYIFCVPFGANQGVQMKQFILQDFPLLTEAHKHKSVSMNLPTPFI